MSMPSATDLDIDNDPVVEIDREDIRLQMEKLRSTWRRYGYRPIVSYCAEHALSEQRVVDQREYLLRMPWINQRFAQWVLADPECPEVGSLGLSQSSFNDMFRMVHDFVHSSAPLMVIEEQGIRFLRAMAFQQFELQYISQFAMLRQLHIFNQLPDNHRLRRSSTIADNIDFDDLLMGSWIIIGYVTENPGSAVSVLQMTSRYTWFPKEKLIPIVRSVSMNIDMLRSRLLSERRKQISVESAIRTSAFGAKPFVELSQRKHIPWAPHLVIRAMGDIVVTKLRELGNTDLISDYGCFFEERYVAKAVSLLCDAIHVEKALLPRLAVGEKTVDFVLRFEDAIVMVESKVRAADENTQLAANVTQVGDRLKGSILKAISQGQATAQQIKAGRFTDINLIPNMEIFLLVISTDQHYMGSGDLIAEHTGNERLEKIKQQYGGTLPVPLENVVLCTADGLDTLVVNVECGETTLVKFMRDMKARSLSSDPKDRILTAEQVLKVNQHKRLPSYLQDSESRWMERIQQRYGQRNP